MITQEELRALVDLQLGIQDGTRAWREKRAEIQRRILDGETIEPGSIVAAMVDVQVPK